MLRNCSLFRWALLLVGLRKRHDATLDIQSEESVALLHVFWPNVTVSKPRWVHCYMSFAGTTRSGFTLIDRVTKLKAELQSKSFSFRMDLHFFTWKHHYNAINMSAIRAKSSEEEKDQQATVYLDLWRNSEILNSKDQGRKRNKENCFHEFSCPGFRRATKKVTVLRQPAWKSLSSKKHFASSTMSRWPWPQALK